GQVRLDPSFESAQYNYLTQSWYVEIMEQLEKGQKLFWSKPYYENQGAKTLMTTVGAGIYHDGKLIGLSTVDWQMNAIRDSILNIKPTPNSFVLFADKANNYIIASTEPGVASTTLMGKPLQELNWYSEQLQEGRPFDYKGKKYIPYIRQLDNGLFLIVNVPFTELFRDIERHLFVLLSLLLISTFFIVGILYWVLKRNINGPISKLSQMAQDIGQGNLNLTIRLDKPKELANLASVLNKMTTDIKTHLVHLAKVSHEKEKIESELAIAKTIQASAVPQDFPKDDSVELLASMTPAREVGGDFYDFFPIDEDRFAFVMADVSGKGITAALYMMSAKTAIRNMLQAGYPLVEAISRANKSLYENHARGMFVTAFVGVLNRRTGHVDYISAGHCAPLHKTKTGYDYVPVIRNLMLGVMPTYAYEAGSFVLRPKDRLFLYTDGVTEAQTKEEKLFGPERLQKALNRKDMTLPETLISVRQAIQRFVKGAEQSDDITMMILEFHKKK
ncbi:MAG: SpoIIE family protein phosphatase, partial [Alphaproteobacteria bacterium]|nr:SpoIIE family protein phosphatase [Alphaproteobacteria bacterium]